jgi:hypothetical protein
MAGMQEQTIATKLHFTVHSANHTEHIHTVWAKCRVS